MEEVVPKETRTLEYPEELFDPKLWLNFVWMPKFEKDWKKLGFDDEDQRALEISIMVDPLRPPLIQGTGGLRKIRFASDASDQGKSGGARVLYAYFESAGMIVVFLAFGKKDIAELPPAVKSQLKQMLTEVRDKLNFD